MNWLAVTFVATALATVMLTVMVRAIARRYGVVDHPDGKRKLHSRPVARWGGVAVYLALGLGLMLAGQGRFGVDACFHDLACVLVVSAGIVCFFGAMDDCWCLGSKVKLLLQIVAVLPLVVFGYWVDRITAFGVPIALGWFGIPLTILWLVGCINSLNLLDGMDGLASTVGLVTAAMLALIAVTQGHDHVAVIATVMAAALCGFLVHNLPPASIFLGDSGSMVIGLVLGVLAMQGAMKTSTTLAITVPAVVMALPLFDTFLAVLRRKLTGRSFAAADRGHIHHRLLDRGMSPWQALCLIGALSLTTGAAATTATILRHDAVAWITAGALLVLLVRLRLFGHHEVALVKTYVAQRLIRLARRLHAPLAGQAALSGAPREHDDCEHDWQQLAARAEAWSAAGLELAMTRHGELQRQWRWSGTEPPTPAAWTMTIVVCDAAGHACEAALTVDAATPLEHLAADAAEALARAVQRLLASAAPAEGATLPLSDAIASPQGKAA